MTWGEWVDAELAEVRLRGQWRSLRPLDGRGPNFSLPDGRVVTSFASNDYLGLSQHPAVVAAAHAALDRWGAGTGSSRLIVGDRAIHAELEGALADWRGTDTALVFPTGYQANLALMTTFGAGARIVSDELNHASIIDGCRLAGTDVAVYRHCDVDHAGRLLKESPGRAIVVSDTVFSMDGDVAPVLELAELCERTGSLLVLDDAHAALGAPAVDAGCDVLRVGTLSKTLGSLGGFVAGRASFVDLLVNRARSFIFTTGLSPADAAAALAAVGVYRSPEGESLRSRLREVIEVVRPAHASPIVPFVVGGEADAVALAEDLLGQGFLVPAIRPPTVPRGTSRLRVSLCALHRKVDVQRLASELGRVR